MDMYIMLLIRIEKFAKNRDNLV